MKNKYEIRGDDVVIFLDRRDGTQVETYTSLCYLSKLLEFNIKWRVAWNKVAPTFYVKGTYRDSAAKRKTILLHRYLLEVTDPRIEVDHLDHNGLNNRKSNLRPLIHSHNTQNKRAYKNSSTGIRGVCFDKKTKKYRCSIQSNGKTLFAKYVDSLEEAARLVRKKRKEIFRYSVEEEEPLWY